MADPAADPALSVCFSVTIDSHDLGAFMTCEGLAVEVTVEQREEGGNNLFVHQLPGRIKYTNVKFTRPVNAESAKVRDWLASMSGGVSRTTAEIVAMSSDGKKVASWGLTGVFPVKWQGPSFSLDSPKVATETLELAHHGFLSSGGLRAVAAGAKLEKAHLIVVEPPSPATKPPSVAAVQGNARVGKGEITFQFNPKEYSVKKSSKWERKAGKGSKSAAMPEFMGPEPRALDLEVFLDQSDSTSGDVVKDVEALFACLEPTEKTRASKKPSPPWVIFGWGAQVAIVAVVKSVSAKFTMFRADGSPIRAVCAVSLEEVPTEAQGQNPTSGARSATRTRRVGAGDSLASIAFAEYDDAGLWRALADANAIDDPLRVPEGTVLDIPALADAADREKDGPALMGQPHTNTLGVEVGGSPLPADMAALLVSAWVDDNLHLPDLFVLSFRDPDRLVLKKAGIEIGAPIVLSVNSGARSAPEKLLAGEVTALEAEFSQAGSFTVVRGFDHAHRLFRGRTSESYRNVTYSDVARLVARRAGLTAGRIDDSRTVHPHVAQGNESDWQFLAGLAAEIGFEVAAVEGKLDFRRPTPSEEAHVGDHSTADPLALVPGTSLLRFRSTVTSAEQVKEVVVRGWDVGRKQVVVGRAAAATGSAEIGVAPADLAGRFGSPVHSVEAPFAGQAEVDALAKAIADQIAGAFAEFEGVARGDPKLRAGKAVSLGLAGDPFDGRYTLTTTRHVFDPDEGYTTWFTASGRQERSLLGLASGGAGAGGAAAPGGVPGVVSAIVTDVRDPENQCRVKVKFPAMSESYESDWARTVQAGAGAARGAVTLPEVNDEVLVAFERGDLRRPYIVGGLYNGVDAPDLGTGLVDQANGAVNRRGFVSRTGHGLVFLDGDGDGGVALLTGDRQLRVSLNESTKTVKITGPGDVIVDAGGKVSVTAKGDLELSGASITLKAQSGVKVDGGGGGIDLKGAGAAKLKGATATVEGDSQAELKGGALASVSAAMVKIN